MTTTDSWQCHNGKRWCWVTAREAARRATQGWEVRLVGPPTTDPTSLPDWLISYGTDGMANRMTWIPDGARQRIIREMDMEACRADGLRIGGAA